MEKAENQEVTKKKRDIVGERLKQRYPDKDFSDDEAMYGQINEDYDEYDNRIKGYEDREKKLGDMFNNDPRSAAFLINWRDGADPVVELVRQFGNDITDAANDPDRIEAIAKANQEFAERVAKNKQLQEEYEKNLETSLQMLDDMEKTQGVPEADIDAAMELLIGIVGDALVGKFTPDAVHMALKAVHHDSDVQRAAEEGEIRGRNAKIDMSLRKPSSGDGVPQINGANNAKKKRPSTLFDIAADAR